MKNTLKYFKIILPHIILSLILNSETICLGLRGWDGLGWKWVQWFDGTWGLVGVVSKINQCE